MEPSPGRPPARRSRQVQDAAAASEPHVARSVADRGRRRHRARTRSLAAVRGPRPGDAPQQTARNDFMRRHLLARVMSSLFGATLCLTLVMSAHLGYIFQGRSSLLMVDLLVVSVTAAVAIGVL